VTVQNTLLETLDTNNDVASYIGNCV